MENTKNDVSIWEILGACVLGACIAVICLTVYFYVIGGF
jgi:hypothetical protein